MIFNMTGGANPLNFYVKTYPSEDELKADKPKENTIGVITNTTMTNWVFSAKEPTEPEVGMVWISVSTSSPVEFNAIKNKTLMVYPLSAKQYEGSKWVDKIAYSYPNEEWVEWLMYLYNSGNEYTDITGGFYYEAKRPQSNQNDSGTATLTKNQTNMVLTHTSTSSAWGSAICVTRNKINLADEKNIVLNYSGLTASEAYLCVWSAIGTYTIDNIVSKVQIPTPAGEISLDTTSLSEEYIVGVYITNTFNFTGVITINSIYCEKE